MTKTKKIEFDYNELPILQKKFYANRVMNEFIEREALELGGYDASIQGVIRKYIFKDGWKKRLSFLRRKQRAAGSPDTDFYDDKTRHEMGLPPKMHGLRRRRNINVGN